MIRWLKIALYTMFAICGQTSAALLTRFYYEKGGTSKWIGTLVQVIGFPVLFPYYMYPRIRSKPKVLIETTSLNTKPPSLPILLSLYVCLGLLSVGNSFLYSVGFEYLPVSTLTLVAASQLAFNAFFSYFLNSQKFTPFIVNSLVLVTLSSVLLVANNKSEKPVGISEGQYVAGFVCTIFAAAINGFLVAFQQFAFRRVLKSQTFKVVMDLTICQSLFASIIALMGFFATGNWKGMKAEMEGFEMGKVSYVMTLLGASIAYQSYTFGAIALIFEVSALFSNVSGALGLPITTIIAMFVFHDKMNGIKGISMVLALWGFTSYAYQQYLDDRKLNAENKNGSQVSEA